MSNKKTDGKRLRELENKIAEYRKLYESSIEKYNIAHDNDYVQMIVDYLHKEMKAAEENFNGVVKEYNDYVLKKRL